MTDTACSCDNPAQSILQIPPGLPALPRQTQTFPDVRRALLATVPTRPALDGWRARGQRDFGLMWLEMLPTRLRLAGASDNQTTLPRTTYLQHVGGRA